MIQLKKGMTFKSTLRDWRGSVIKVTDWETRSVASNNRKVFVDVKELITGSEHTISKETLESKLYYEVEQDKGMLGELEYFAKEKTTLVKEIKQLKKIQDALSKISVIPGQREFEANIVNRINEKHIAAKSMLKSWELELNRSYKKVKA